MRTINEIQANIKAVIGTSKSTQDLLVDLEVAGYPVIYTWIKGNGIGNPFFFKRKRIYRIQVTHAELCGKFYKAWCVEVQASSIQQNITVS